jgi:hypothetical protein
MHALEARRTHPSEVVREHVAWAMTEQAAKSSALAAQT